MDRLIQLINNNEIVGTIRIHPPNREEQQLAKSSKYGRYVDGRICVEINTQVAIMEYYQDLKHLPNINRYLHDLANKIR